MPDALVMIELLSSGDTPKLALSSCRNKSLSPEIFLIIVVCFVPPSLTLEYTGRNPTAPFGLFPVLLTANGISSLCAIISSSVGGAHQPFGKIFGLNIALYVIAGGAEYLGSALLREATRMLAGLFLKMRFIWVFECFPLEMMFVRWAERDKAFREFIMLPRIQMGRGRASIERMLA